MQLEFGEGTDHDTFETFFGHLARAGYIVRLNGHDMTVYSTRPDLSSWAYVPKDKFKADTVGLYGFKWDEETCEPDLTKPYGAAWDQIVEVLIY